MYRTLGELWSGNYSRAAVSAQEMIEASQRPELVDMYATFVKMKQELIIK